MTKGWVKLSLQYATDCERDAREDARAKTPSRCQNDDADVVPFTISFDERQRQANTRMRMLILYEIL